MDVFFKHMRCLRMAFPRTPTERSGFVLGKLSSIRLPEVGLQTNGEYIVATHAKLAERSLCIDHASLLPFSYTTYHRYKPKGLDSCFGNFPMEYKRPDQWDGNPTLRRDSRTSYTSPHKSPVAGWRHKGTVRKTLLCIELSMAKSKYNQTKL